MTREQLAHVLRAVADITRERDVLMIGSQSILGSFSDPNPRIARRADPCLRK